MRTIQEIPATQRPYERFLEYGPKALSDAELLANLLRSGTRKENVLEIASRLVDLSDRMGGLCGLCRMTLQDLKSIPGIGNVKSAQILCLAELSRRIASTERKMLPLMDSPEQIADCYMEEMRHLEQEELRVVMLDGRNRFLTDVVLFKGTVNASLISPREVFLEALKNRAVGIVLLHNHPSGDPSPSREDILITEKMEEAGFLLDIPLLDHIIIGNLVYSSFKERGMLHG